MQKISRKYAVKIHLNMQKNMTNMKGGSTMENMQENMQNYAKYADHAKNMHNMHFPPC